MPTEGRTGARGMGRREFVRRATAGAAGLTLLSRGAWATPPSDRIVVAHIGVGGMGRAHLRWFADFEDVEIAALCDVDGAHLGRALGESFQVVLHPCAVAGRCLR